ncbi:MAG: hypothetical protein JW810_03350 [Sedimentisphaerales bacterium]|nr:hypothetical protein [Sedimentisphaerales bacterium]
MITLPQYITKEEVRRVCSRLGIRDWTALDEPGVTVEEAGKILAQVNQKSLPVSPEAFRLGLEVELEHGTQYEDANVTNNHPLLTGMIVMAHLKESLDYYQRLEVAEIEGDMLKALVAQDAQKLYAKCRKLIAARQVLATSESAQLS